VSSVVVGIVRRFLYVFLKRRGVDIEEFRWGNEAEEP